MICQEGEMKNWKGEVLIWLFCSVFGFLVNAAGLLTLMGDVKYEDLAHLPTWMWVFYVVSSIVITACIRLGFWLGALRGY